MTKAKKAVAKKATKKVKVTKEAALKEKIGAKIADIIKETTKIVKKWKMKKEWIEKEKEVAAAYKEVMEATERANKLRDEFWKMIETGVKFDAKKYKGQHVHLHFNDKDGVVELIKHDIPEGGLCGVING